MELSDALTSLRFFLINSFLNLASNNLLTCYLQVSGLYVFRIRDFCYQMVCRSLWATSILLCRFCFFNQYSLMRGAYQFLSVLILALICCIYWRTARSLRSTIVIQLPYFRFLTLFSFCTTIILLLSLFTYFIFSYRISNCSDINFILPLSASYFFFLSKSSLKKVLEAFRQNSLAKTPIFSDAMKLGCTRNLGYYFLPVLSSLIQLC